VREIRILVLGDGPNEIAKHWETLLATDLPALPRLVHRLLGEPGNVSYDLRLFRRVVHASGKGDAPEKKTEAVIRFARQNHFHAIVILLDRDRAPTAKKIRPLQDRREAIAASAYLPCAIGCAIEAFDAWMIVDGAAIGAAGGQAGRTHPDPEKLDGKEGTGRHPKDRAIELFGSRDVLTGAYAAVAARVDLGLLGKACPQGFAPFAAEVKERIAPVVGGR
jgi:hypothetical protein